MFIEISPTLFSIGFAVAFGICGYMVAKFFYIKSHEEVIDETIQYLITNNYIKSKTVDGQLKIVPLSEE